MKTIEIGGDVVTYHFKDADGNTIATTLKQEDKACIERDIDKGKDKGRLVIDPNVTLFWSVSFD